VQAVLLAGHVIVNVVASAFFAAVEPVSLSHNCIHSDEVTTIDLGSGREQVGVTQGRPELNPAGTSAGTRLWKLTKPYSSNWLGLEAEVGFRPPSCVCKYLVRNDLLEAEVGIGHFCALFVGKSSQFAALRNQNPPVHPHYPPVSL
jgi:hypothetical protein